MKIVYVAMEYDYGFRERGKSFEEFAFYDTLHSMGHHLIRFDFVEQMKSKGRSRMNDSLRELVFDERPDLAFFVLFKNEIDKKIVAEITRNSGAITLNWFCDDHWRFNTFSRFYAPSFSWVTTTDREAVPKYKAIGYNNVILTQWACNERLFKKINDSPIYDVTFVGQPHGDRRRIIEYLRTNGINVHTWGYGWETGRVSLQQMVQIFSQSKINLNLSNSSRSRWRFWERRRDQMKGRNFEIPSCGGFQLASYVDGIEEFFSLGCEIVCFRTLDEMVHHIRYYLDNEDSRKLIAEGGHERALRDHTYRQRFESIFEKIFA